MIFFLPKFLKVGEKNKGAAEPQFVISAPAV
jgi:hypothetical protein